jgi:hypothetical protein
MWFMVNDAATDFIRNLQNDPSKYPDRVVGIVLGAMLDERLSSTLQACVQHDTKLVEKSFNHESNLFGTFGARTNLGFFLGLFSKETHRDLELVAKIRNRFAHKVEVALFDDNPVCNWVDELKIPKKRLEINNGTTVWDFSPQNLPALKSRREIYIRARVPSVV